MPHTSARGRMISIEGPDGAGKSTQVTRLVASLKDIGIDVVRTREPGGSPGAEEIRALLVSGETTRWSGVTEALLHFAARRDHLERTIWPAMEMGHWVITDRFVDSTYAYQGYGHQLPLTDLDALAGVALGGFTPDLTVVIDVPADIGLRRALVRGGVADRYEKMAAEFHERLRAGFLARAAMNPGRYAVVDGFGDPDTVASEVLATVRERLALD